MRMILTATGVAALLVAGVGSGSSEEWQRWSQPAPAFHPQVEMDRRAQLDREMRRDAQRAKLNALTGVERQLREQNLRESMRGLGPRKTTRPARGAVTLCDPGGARVVGRPARC